ncbi:hypothetical protein FPCIR_9671 [Fusarium pseudocircinatum]|uniref:Uncharacterized protein n=1 Tax=Fusarium pseudocircinatum TaxID=56676 RepID=A0A8H5KX53_9HYPO|nr:hypothetical protein FPCIR_9671 [Fusarium pseudocircinatum]
MEFVPRPKHLQGYHPHPIIPSPDDIVPERNPQDSNPPEHFATGNAPQGLDANKATHMVVYEPQNEPNDFPPEFAAEGTPQFFRQDVPENVQVDDHSGLDNGKYRERIPREQVYGNKILPEDELGSHTGSRVHFDESLPIRLPREKESRRRGSYEGGSHRREPHRSESHRREPRRTDDRDKKSHRSSSHKRDSHKSSKKEDSHKKKTIDATPERFPHLSDIPAFVAHGKAIKEIMKKLHTVKFKKEKLRKDREYINKEIEELEKGDRNDERTDIEEDITELRKELQKLDDKKQKLNLKKEKLKEEKKKHQKSMARLQER